MKNAASKTALLSNISPNATFKNVNGSNDDTKMKMKSGSSQDILRKIMARKSTPLVLKT